METLLNDALYLLFRDLLRNRSGLFYPEHKRDDLEHGLSLVLKVTGHRSMAELYSDALNDDTTWETILAHLTIGETSFFRNKPQFHALRHHIFPEIFGRRTNLRSIRIWSAGCATGEEPYSIAMLLQDILPDIQSWNISILATDINPNFLLRAREGLYGAWSFRDTPDDIKDRFFSQEGNRWRLLTAIRSMVSFNRINLIETTYPSITNGTSALDMILCRNVTIYFDEQTTRQIVGHFYHALAPGGWLIVGHSEPQASIYHQFEVHNFPNTVVYRKKLDAPLFTLDQTTAALSSSLTDLNALIQQLKRGSQSSTMNEPVAPVSDTQSAHSVAPSVPVSHAQFALMHPSDSQIPSSLSAGTSTFSFLPPTPTPPANPIPPLVQSPSVAGKPVVSPQAPPTQERQSSDPGPLWNKAKMLLSQGDKHNAEKYLTELLVIKPDHVEARTVLGRLCADRGEWGCAQYHCESAIASNPLHIEAHYTLAQIYEHEELLDDALGEYRRAVYLDRAFIPGILGMANVWRQLGRYDEARRGYRNALKQLALLSPSAIVSGSDGASASELAAYATRQLQSLG